MEECAVSARACVAPDLRSQAAAAALAKLRRAAAARTGPVSTSVPDILRVVCERVETRG